MIKTIIKNFPKWINSYGLEGDVVISSRIRIARNLSNFKFPNRASIDEKKNVIESVKKVFKENKYLSNLNLIGYNLLDLNDLERKALVEMHILSPNFIVNPYYKYFFINEEGTISIMLNEEDHIRIQYIKEGFITEDIVNFSYKISDELEDSLDIAFLPDFGYLTSCPTNLGTGLRVSLLCHFPFLNYTNKIKDFIENSAKFSISFRGSFGEGTNPLSSLYQISNSTTLGKSEENIVQMISKIGKEIIKKERSLRDEIFESNKSEILDKIGRSIGIIKYSKKIDFDEANEILSWLRIGALNKILNMPLSLINVLILKIRPNLMKIEFNTDNDELIDKLRSTYLKNVLSNFI